VKFSRQQRTEKIGDPPWPEFKSGHVQSDLQCTLDITDDRYPAVEQFFGTLQFLLQATDVGPAIGNGRGFISDKSTDVI